MEQYHIYKKDADDDSLDLRMRFNMIANQLCHNGELTASSEKLLEVLEFFSPFTEEASEYYTPRTLTNLIKHAADPHLRALRNHMAHTQPPTLTQQPSTTFRSTADLRSLAEWHIDQGNLKECGDLLHSIQDYMLFNGNATLNDIAQKLYTAKKRMESTAGSINIYGGCQTNVGRQEITKQTNKR